MLERIKILYNLVRFEHTIFALPFAYLGMVMAQKGVPGWYYWFWVTLAMAGARTAAMGFNRLIDREIDAKNPRTANRHLPKKQIAPQTVWFLVIVSLILLEFSAYKLNWLCVYLSPIVVVLLWGYSYCKRFTWLTHFVLGLVEAAAPIGGWIAVTGSFALPPIDVGLAVIFWLAGFDIIYACQDYEFDKKEGIFSIPANFGLGPGLAVSAILHILTIVFLVLAGLSLHLGIWYWSGIAMNGILLIYEHAIISPKDLSRINQAFFTVNGYVSVVLFVCTLLDVLFKHT